MSATIPLTRPMPFDLGELANQLRAGLPYEKEGHTAQTLLREADSRVVLVVLRAGSRIREHAALETAAVQALSGRFKLHLEGAEPVELRAGSLLAIPAGVRHDVEAGEDGAFLLTLGAPKHAA